MSEISSTTSPIFSDDFDMRSKVVLVFSAFSTASPVIRVEWATCSAIS